MSLRSQVISDPVYAERLDELQQQAMTRTGGKPPSLDWQGVIKMSNENPSLSRVAGLFPGDDLAPEKHGSVSLGLQPRRQRGVPSSGSTRRTDVKIPFGYLLAWDMIRWAKEIGVGWFDMGGVTLAEDNETELEGISRFKRYFSREVAEVGAEWILEPAPMVAKMATAVSSGASRVRGWMRKSS